ncbi:MAG TPA: TolC family protein, partial [Dongiaceae bacterium]|nr:TolC family protein [Dongiaceae bacterium]
MKTAYRFALLMLIAPRPILAQGVTAPEKQVTVDEAVSRALSVQPAMVEAEGTRRNAKASDRSAVAAFLPTLTTSAGAARNNTIRTDLGVPQPSGYSYTIGLNANLELFDGFRRYAQKKAASANLDAAEAGLLNERYQVTLTTKQLFYDA